MATPEPYPYRQLNYPVNNLEQNFDQTKKIQVRANIGIPTSVNQTDKVLGVTAATGELGWVPSAGYTPGNMLSVTNGQIDVTTTAGITDIQMVNALPANPEATVLYLIPEA